MHAVPSPSLDDLLVAQGARLRSHRSSSCLLCGGIVRVQRGGGGDRFRCVGCGTEIASLPGATGAARRAA